MNQERLLNIILSPYVSEKATTVMEKNNEYVFKVVKDALKSEIKDAIELLFNTKVKDVRTTVMRAKKKMFKGVEGSRKSWKKAYVTLMADQKLDMIVGQ